MLLAGTGRKSSGGSDHRSRFLQLLILFAAAISMGWAGPVHARKVALIIANAGYKEPVRTLTNPYHDARLVEEAATKAGFEVKIVDSAGRPRMLAELNEFRTRAEGAEVAMIYYAGHGTQIGNRQFALPSDADLSSEFMVENTGVDVAALTRALEPADKAILVLDACRDNLVAGSGAETYRSASVGIQNLPQAPGVFVMLSAGPNQRAKDGEPGQGSPFAQVFSKWFQTPGLTLSDFSDKVGQEVSDMSTGPERQTPYGTSGGGLGGLVFYPNPTPVPAAPVVVPQMEGADFAAAVKADTLEAFEAYIAKWPNGANEFFARGKISRFKEMAAAQSEPFEVIEHPSTGTGQLANGRAETAGARIGTDGGHTGRYSPNSSNGGQGEGTSGRDTQMPGDIKPVPFKPVMPPGQLTNNAGDGTNEPGARPVTPPVAPSTGNGGFSPPNEAPVTVAIGGGQCGYTADQLTAARNRGENPCGDTKRFRPTQDQKQLPEFPAPPKFSDASYPACRNEYLNLPGDYDKLNSLKACLEKLSQYREKDLNSFVATMNTFLGTVSEIYRVEMKLDDENYYYSPETQNSFTAKMKDEHVKGKAGGEYMQAYEATSKRQADDWIFLSQEFQTINARYLSQTRQ